MLLKTNYSQFDGNNIPQKMEAVDNRKVHITLEKVNDIYSVFFADEYNIKPKGFATYSEANHYFNVCCIRLEDMVNAQEEKDKAKQELTIRNTISKRAETKFHSWVK